LHLQDIIRGDVKFETSLLDDKVLFKSDGMPTYHLANIVDDHLMETSMLFVVKNGCLHALTFCTEPLAGMRLNLHIPLILKPVGNGKLSNVTAINFILYFHWSGKLKIFHPAIEKRILP
jgi:glutamyl-tRNA synthetase